MWNMRCCGILINMNLSNSVRLRISFAATPALATKYQKDEFYGGALRVMVVPTRALTKHDGTTLLRTRRPN